MTNALAGAPWLRAMARVFADTPLYLVGGAVRNPLMGLPLSDMDVCGPARPERVCALCEGTQVRAVLRAAHFGTVELHLTDETGAHHMAEYTTWREDSYRCGHRPDSVRFTEDIRVDALRRDFSVNAMYRRVYEDRLGDVIDPTGGLAHLRAGVLHTVSENPDRVLGEDGLRILRAARFQAQLDLRPTPALRESLRRNAPLLADIARERLRDEWEKTVMADLRYPTLKRREPGTAAGLATLHECGAWPYLADGIAYDEEAAKALWRLNGPTLPAAALTARRMQPDVRMYPAPEVLPARLALLLRAAKPEEARNTLLTLRFSVHDADCAARYLAALQLPDESPFAWAKLGPDALAFACDAFSALGDAPGQARAARAAQALAGKPLSLRDLALNGDDLKPLFAQNHIPPRQMGQTLQALWQAAVEGRVPNTKEALLQRAAQEMK